ncbi:uncharacterized protein LOC144447765 [Glandiceps talaboti]
MADFSNDTLIMAYNLLAHSKSDIDETFNRMFEAFMGNLSHNISAVLISATNDKDLKIYEKETCEYFRGIIHKVLLVEGLKYGNGMGHTLDRYRLKYFWSKYTIEYVRDNVEKLCLAIVNEFMLIQRVSRVLRKCGQYQDLMLLSAGDDTAYTYTDKLYYGPFARKFGEPLFHQSPAVDNIFGRNFDYTLVLDGDTGIMPGDAHKLLLIAAANPDRGLIQPAIVMEVSTGDTLYMYLEKIRQTVNADTANAVSALLGQCGFFGKALIKNKVYIEKVIGCRQSPLERVPIDVLSHDTFEAAMLKPLYAGDVYLLEAPCFNYVTWDIRERRWNKGEILLMGYFWKEYVGKPMKWIQQKLQKDQFTETRVRTESHFDLVSSYIAHSAIRMMFTKPLLLFYLILQVNVYCIYPYLSFITVMIIVIVLPKIAVLRFDNIHLIIFETLCAILQYTPEAVVGTVRLIMAVKANISKNTAWVPQSVVEDQFKNTNVFVSSFQYLWGYSLFGALVILVLLFSDTRQLWMISMFLTVFVLPLFAAVTSCRVTVKENPKVPNLDDIIEGPSDLVNSKDSTVININDYADHPYK